MVIGHVNTENNIHTMAKLEILPLKRALLEFGDQLNGLGTS